MRKKLNAADGSELNNIRTANISLTLGKMKVFFRVLMVHVHEGVKCNLHGLDCITKFQCQFNKD